MTIKETATYTKLKNKPKDNFPVCLVIHHTGGTNTNPLADTSHHTAKIAEDYHLSLGWEGIGYHFFIEKDGDVWAGRPEHYHGAHVKEQNMNTKSIGICLAGNFDLTLPSEAQVISLKALLKDLMAKYTIPASKVLPHRYFALNPNGTPYKSCYGTKLSDAWITTLIAPPTINVDKAEDKLLRIKKIIEE